MLLLRTRIMLYCSSFSCAEERSRQKVRGWMTCPYNQMLVWHFSDVPSSINNRIHENAGD